MTKELLEEAIRKEAETIPSPPMFPNVPPSQPQEGTPESRAMGAMDLIKAGQKMTVKSERIAPGYNEAYNARVEAARNYNKSMQMEAIQKVAEAVGHNIRAAERTDEILKGTAFDTPGRNPFFGGTVAKEMPAPVGTPDIYADQVGGFDFKATPLPTFVDKDVKYAEMPEYKPTKLSETSTVEKKFAPERGNPQNAEMIPTMMLDNLKVYNTGNESTESRVKGADYGSANDDSHNTALIQKLADVGVNNIQLATGKDPRTTMHNVATNERFDDNALKNYQAWMKISEPDMAKIRSGQYTGTQLADIVAAGLFAKRAKENGSFKSHIWDKAFSHYKDPRTGAVVVRIDDPYNVAERTSTGLPLLSVRDINRPGQLTEADSRKIYTAWLGKNPGKNQVDFARAVATNNVKDADGFAVDLSYKPELREAMNDIATQVNEYMKALGYTKDPRYKKDIDTHASLATKDGWKASFRGNMFNANVGGGFSNSNMQKINKK